MVVKGLEDVTVAETELSRVFGDEGRLIYNGYSIEDLAEHSSFEEVLYLLWHRELPSDQQLEQFETKLRKNRYIPQSVLDSIRELSEAGEGPMDALRMGVSMLAAYDPVERPDPGNKEAVRDEGLRITARIPTLLAAYERIDQWKQPVEPREDLDLASNFLYMLNGEEPDPVAKEVFDLALILHADHGLNASTFTTMVVCSTLADIYGSITGGIAALSGPLHGGANQDVMEVLMELDESDLTPQEWIERAIENDRRIPGWGHRVYNVKDPRAVILQDRLEELSRESGDERWYNYTSTIEKYLTEEVGLPEKGIAPNVDFFSGSVYFQLGISPECFTPIFAMSRVGGWVGHVLEYQEDNRLIRPRGEYVGPEQNEYPDSRKE